MTSDRSRRVRRCYWWGFGAVLAAAAGATAQQSNSNNQTYQPNQSGAQTGQQQGWRQADHIPQLAHGTVVLVKEENNKTTQITVQDGRVVSAEIDGQFASADKVQMQGNRLRVLDENNQVATTIRIPQLSGVAMRGSTRQYGSNEFDRYNQNQQQDQNRYQQDRYTQSNRDQFQTGRDQYQPRDRYQQDQYSDRYTQTDRYGRDYNRDFDRGDDWRLRQSDQFNRDDDRYYRQDTFRQDTYRQDMYRDQPDRSYDTRTETRNYDSRFDNRYNRQGSFQQNQQTDRGRVYGTTESRPAMALGIRTSEAASNDLRVTGNTTTNYTQGIKIEQVQDGMPAATSGLRQGDIIVAIDGRTPATTTVLQQHLAEKSAGDTVQVRVIRNGTEQTVPVRLERIDYSRYNWDYMPGNATTVDHGRDTVDQDLLQQNNKQEIYRPSQDGSGDSGRPLWDRMRDRVNNPNNDNTNRDNTNTNRDNTNTTNPR
jgi:hypothetical protein